MVIIFALMSSNFGASNYRACASFSLLFELIMRGILVFFASCSPSVILPHPPVSDFTFCYMPFPRLLGHWGLQRVCGHVGRRSDNFRCPRGVSLSLPMSILHRLEVFPPVDLRICISSQCYKIILAPSMLAYSKVPPFRRDWAVNG